MKRLPKKLYVKSVQEANTSFFVAHEDFEGLVDMGETVKVGVYELIETKTIKGVVEID